MSRDEPVAKSEKLVNPREHERKRIKRLIRQGKLPRFTIQRIPRPEGKVWNAKGQGRWAGYYWRLQCTLTLLTRD